MAREFIKVSALSLTSLMDIFTVLVFFLLLSMGDGVEEFVNMGGHVEVPSQSAGLDIVSSNSRLISIYNDHVILNETRHENMQTLIEQSAQVGVNLDKVTLKADANTDFQFVKEQLDLLVENGTTDVSLLTTQSG